MSKKSKERADIIQHEAGGNLFTADYPPWLWDSLEKFQDLKFGFFLHWGIYSQWGCIESWPLVADAPWARPDELQAWNERGRDLERFRRDYRALNQTFNPVAFCPEKWAQAAHAAGMKYMAFTTKHHDGFCMFDTRTTDYRVTHPSCPFHQHPRANITKEVFDAFRDRDFAISCYFSKSDWHSPYYWDPQRPALDRHPNYDTHQEPERWQKFVEFVHNQVEELMTGYGPVNALWLDGGQVRPPDQDINMAAMAAMARRHQPGLIVADRTVGGEFENILTPEQTVPDEPLGHPWESCLTMGDSWSYKPGDRYKPAAELITLLLDVVAKGGNLLLNVGPTPSGTLPPEAMQRLQEIGAWMAVNSEAIYATRPRPPYAHEALRYTQTDDAVYVIILLAELDAAGMVRIPQVQPQSDTVELLGSSHSLAWQRQDDDIVVTLPRELPCQHAVTLKIHR